MKKTKDNRGILTSSVKRSELTIDEAKEIFNLAVAYSDDVASKVGLINILRSVKRVNDIRDKEAGKPQNSNYNAHMDLCLETFNEGVKRKHLGFDKWKKELFVNLREYSEHYAEYERLTAAPFPWDEQRVSAVQSFRAQHEGFIPEKAYDWFFMLCYATGLEVVLAENSVQTRIDTPKIKRLMNKGLLVQSAKNPSYLIFSKTANMRKVMALFPKESEPAIMSELAESQCILNAAGNLFTADLMWQFLVRRNYAKPTKEKVSSTRMTDINRKQKEKSNI